MTLKQLYQQKLKSHLNQINVEANEKVPCSINFKQEPTAINSHN